MCLTPNITNVLLHSFHYLQSRFQTWTIPLMRRTALLTTATQTRAWSSYRRFRQDSSSSTGSSQSSEHWETSSSSSQWSGFNSQEWTFDLICYTKKNSLDWQTNKKTQLSIQADKRHDILTPQDPESPHRHEPVCVQHGRLGRGEYVAKN